MDLKVAVVVFVKNEYPDFCSWLAWHFAIGVNTIIVYDDHSTDGTWEAAVAASLCLDVRPYRTDLDIQPFTARQRDVYLSAVKNLRDEFDWIGFIDADEFLHLRHGVDVRSFLSRFPDAAAIAFSWCIYGSNGWLLKPAANTVQAFTRHSLPSFGHNRSVKSFVRPNHVIDRWRDPHTFEVGDLPYVDPQGQPMQWGGPGAIGHEPDWSTAKLMHYIPRSMEHFVERIRRRSDLQGVTNEYWNVFNKNDVQDLEPLEKMPELDRYLFKINNEIMRVFCQNLLTFAHGKVDLLDGPGVQDNALAYSLIKTHFGSVLALDQKNCLVHLPQHQVDELGYRLVYAISTSSSSAILFLVAPHADGPLRIPMDYRVSDILPYLCQTDAAVGTMTLRIPRSRHLLSALPPEASGAGRTSADRWHAKDWEQFTTLAVDHVDTDAVRYAGLSSLISAPASTADAVMSLARTGASQMVCAAAIYLLADRERASIVKNAHGVLPAWV